MQRIREWKNMAGNVRGYGKGQVTSCIYSSGQHEGGATIMEAQDRKEKNTEDGGHSRRALWECQATAIEVRMMPKRAGHSQVYLE